MKKSEPRNFGAPYGLTAQSRSRATYHPDTFQSIEKEENGKYEKDRYVVPGDNDSGGRLVRTGHLQPPNRLTTVWRRTQKSDSAAPKKTKKGPRKPKLQK